MDFSKLIEGIKLSPRYLFAGALVTGLLLFSPASFLGGLGLSGFIEEYRPWIGVTFLVALTLWLSHGLAPWARTYYRRFQEYLVLRGGRKYLHDLTQDEKVLLRAFLEAGTRTQRLSVMSGVVQGLTAQTILYRASNLGHMTDFDHNIQPWAWDYLRKHPELVSEAGSGTRLTYGCRLRRCAPRPLRGSGVEMRSLVEVAGNSKKSCCSVLGAPVRYPVNR